MTDPIFLSHIFLSSGRNDDQSLGRHHDAEDRSVGIFVLCLGTGVFSRQPLAGLDARRRRGLGLGYGRAQASGQLQRAQRFGTRRSVLPRRQAHSFGQRRPFGDRLGHRDRAQRDYVDRPHHTLVGACVRARRRMAFTKAPRVAKWSGSITMMLAARRSAPPTFMASLSRLIGDGWPWRMRMGNCFYGIPRRGGLSTSRRRISSASASRPTVNGWRPAKIRGSCDCGAPGRSARLRNWDDTRRASNPSPSRRMVEKSSRRATTRRSVYGMPAGANSSHALARTRRPCFQSLSRPTANSSFPASAITQCGFIHAIVHCGDFVGMGASKAMRSSSPSFPSS